MSSKYLSIADFAETAGISKQAVYQRLNTESLKPFIAIVDGKKAISSDALKFFKVESIENKATIKDLLIKRLFMVVLLMKEKHKLNM